MDRGVRILFIFSCIILAASTVEGLKSCAAEFSEAVGELSDGIDSKDVKEISEAAVACARESTPESRKMLLLIFQKMKETFTLEEVKIFFWEFKWLLLSVFEYLPPPFDSIDPLIRGGRGIVQLVKWFKTG